MNPNEQHDDPAERVSALLARYSDAAASTALLLCDRHDPDRIAYRVVTPDLSSVDLTYGALRSESERLAAALFETDSDPGTALPP